MEETQLKLDIDTSPAKKSIKDVRQEIKAIENEMVNLDSGSNAFKQAARKAGELKHQLDEVQKAVSGASSDFGDMVGNVAKTGAGITGAFQAAKGAMDLFGVESEGVTEAIKKMQSVMAMTQGLASIDEGIKSFSKLKTVVGLNSKEMGKFKKALISTGLGALVVVLGSIIANWDEFSKEIGISTSQMEKFGQMFQGVVSVIMGSTKKIASAFAKLIKGDFSGAFDELKSGWDFQQMYAEGVEKAITRQQKAEAQKRLDAQQKYIDDMNKEYDRQRSKAEATIDDEVEKTKELISIEEKRLKLYKEGTKEYYDQLKKVNVLKAKSDDSDKEDPEKAAAEARKKANEQLDIQLEQNKRLEQAETERLQKEIDIETQRLTLLEEGTLAYEKQLTKIEELKAKLMEAEASPEEGSLLDNLTQISIALADISTQFDTLSSGVTAGFDSLGFVFSTISKVSDDLAKAKEEFTQFGDAGKYAGAKAAAGLKIAAVAAQGISNVLSAVATEQDTNTKEGFEKQKKLQTASAVMSMLSGITAALSGLFTTKSGPWDIALAATQAAMIGAMGSVQIANIQKQTFDGGASSSAVSANIAQPALPALTQPVQYTQDVQGPSIEGALSDTRVIVTETDITNTQKKVNVTETESKF